MGFCFFSLVILYHAYPYFVAKKLEKEVKRIKKEQTITGRAHIVLGNFSDEGIVVNEGCVQLANKIIENTKKVSYIPVIVIKKL